MLEKSDQERVRYKKSAEQFGVAVTLGSNLDQGNHLSRPRFITVFLGPSSKYYNSTLNRPRSFPSKSFLNYYSLITPLSTPYTLEILTASWRKSQNDDDDDDDEIIYFFVYYHADLNSRWPVTESVRIQTIPAIRQHRTKQTNNNNEECSNLHSPNTEKGALKLAVRAFIMCNAEMCDNKYNQESRYRIQSTLTEYENFCSSVTAAFPKSKKTQIILL
jgi:hypothetical protein